MFAHATGFTWDEALMVMAPVAILGGVLLLANARANKLRETGSADDAAPSEDEPVEHQ